MASPAKTMTALPKASQTLRNNEYKFLEIPPEIRLLIYGTLLSRPFVLCLDLDPDFWDPRLVAYGYQLPPVAARLCYPPGTFLSRTEGVKQLRGIIDFWFSSKTITIGEETAPTRAFVRGMRLNSRADVVFIADGVDERRIRAVAPWSRIWINVDTGIAMVPSPGLGLLL